MTAAEHSYDEALKRPVTAVLATNWTRGRLHAVPVWFLFEDGIFKVITGRGSQKQKNAARSGRASICIPETGAGGRYITAEGPVEIVDPLSFEQRLAMHVHYRGEEAARRIVEKGGHEQMVLLVLRPETWLSEG